jgi:NADPH2:quinone reductase
MRKVLINQFGTAEVLTVVTDAPKPAPSAGQVLVAVSSAGINPIDFKIREGSSFMAQLLAKQLPIGLGYELAGTVVAIGKDVSNLQVGDRVTGLLAIKKEPCCYAEYVAADANLLVKIPEGVSFSSAAALPLAGLTAYQALNLFDDLSGKSVLISAGAGGVGHFAVQLAKLKGATVVATASANNHAFLKEIGAATCIDYHDQQALADLDKVDCILDLVGKTPGIAALQNLKTNGKLVTVPTIDRDNLLAEAKKLQLNAEGMLVSPNNEQLNYLLELIANKQLAVVVEEFPLEEVIAAHQKIEAGHVRGKLCLVT